MISGQGALQGASIGAGMGSSFGPWGTAIGAGVGAIGGAFGLGKKSGPSGPSYYDLLNQRNNEMNSFANKLAMNRANYLQSMQNLNKTVMSQFAPDLEASYGARGLNVTGGAYQAELARKSALLGSEANVNAARMGQQDINSVINFGGNPMSLGNPYGMAGYNSELDAQRSNSQAIGGLVGSGLSSLMNQGVASRLNSSGGGLGPLFGRTPVAPSSQPGYESFNNYNNRATGNNEF